MPAVARTRNNAFVGEGFGPPHAITCTPLLPLTQLKATDIRAVGGVDKTSNYAALTGSMMPLKANKLAVPDPLTYLPVPTTTTDPANVSSTNYGARTIIGLPVGPKIQLYPGVYDYINVVIGRVKFNPGIYIIRGQHPVTKHSLLLTAGEIEAEGVMFYLTNSAGYVATSGSPDASDGETEPSGPLVGSVIPSAIINIGLLGSSFTPLNSPGSPFDGMMIFQRRHDRRPIVIVQENLLGAGTLEGTMYAKWGHIILAGKGEYNARFVAGTMRIIALLDCQIKPTELLAPATDVFLVE